MGDYFRVEVSELDRLLRQLKESRQEMREALSAMRDTGPKTTGSKALDRACDDFDDSWQDAITRIAQGVEAIEGKLRETSRNYAETDEAIRAAFAKGAA
ncbi:type VII secretion target [Kitasatospora sp. NPDC049285]|uniref:WXG100 family type VII secretion target n=1 Tax=Kitasatospora sp. NPDC049285 TaxID=3157096 RepID=UPI0034315D37